MWDDGVDGIETLTLLSLLRDLPLIFEWGALEVPLPCYWAPYEHGDPSRKSKGTLLSVLKATGVCTIGLLGSLLHIGLYIALLCLCMKCICVLYGYVHICREVYIHTRLHIYIDYTCLHIHVEARVWHQVAFCITLVFEKETLIEPRVDSFSWMAVWAPGNGLSLARTGMPASLASYMSTNGWMQVLILSLPGKNLLAEPSFQSFHHSWSLPDLSSFFACWNMFGQILVLLAIIYPWWIQIFYTTKPFKWLPAQDSWGMGEGIKTNFLYYWLRMLLNHLRKFCRQNDVLFVNKCAQHSPGDKCPWLSLPQPHTLKQPPVEQCEEGQRLMKFFEPSPHTPTLICMGKTRGIYWSKRTHLREAASLFLAPGNLENRVMCPLFPGDSANQ